MADGSGSYGRPRVSGKALPFGLGGDRQDAIIVHFTIAEENMDKRQEIAAQINNAMKDCVIGGMRVVPVITGTDVTMTITTAKTLAAHCIPSMLDALGMPRTGALR